MSSGKDGKQEMTLEEQMVSNLIKRKETISCAESCTGGLLSARLVNVAGVSAVYKQGYITYSDEAKQKVLQISGDILKKHTAVSSETAGEMAKGVCYISGADWGLSTTGYAGPEGGKNGDPAGLVFIGCSHHGHTCTRKLLLTGTRQQIREEAVTAALSLLAEQMKGEKA